MWPEQAILPFLKRDEDAVGSAVSITHRSPAPVGATVTITAFVVSIDGRRILCAVEVRYGETIVADGTIEQRVVLREKLRQMIKGLYPDQDQASK